MLFIANGVSIPEIELDFSAIRAQGPGGQNVNKVSSAIHLRFDIQQSSLPDFYKQRLLKLNDQRISKDGVVIIKAQSYRSQDKNRVEALSRLQLLVQSAGFTAKPRRPTKPTRGSQMRRMDKKSQHGKKKIMRGKPSLD
ncbi:MAG: alternative ribosome rescue aminoacyl-tRNA hydrolase ArfB [Porticoccaceae bacterium]|jgi:ribosome-associated protein|nr:alternative ribosome rescue aminoacyl-tRNA hydrolase ArfB [bacterium]MDG1244741.1 alternative ribosome rescue aminoacyl-tRNA hydrolase ArfB [Porticoccaceae bacterium]MDG2145535.1 alternative ribosome rescue aminoacyl-tRNA hydrolase ArfB [Porticoccaceae bacterium]